MPSSVRFGSRPMAWRTRSYSSGDRPCSATISGVMRFGHARACMPSKIVCRRRRSGVYDMITLCSSSTKEVENERQSDSGRLSQRYALSDRRRRRRRRFASTSRRSARPRCCGMPMGDRIAHAEIRIGDSHVMLADEFPDMGHLGPNSARRRDRQPDDLSRRTSMPPSRARSPPARTARAAGRGPVLGRPHGHAQSIRSATAGRSPPMSRTCRPRRWSGAWPRRSSSPA